MPKDKTQIKEEMNKHPKEVDRFRVFFNGVLDQAEHMVNDNASREQMLSAISGLREQLTEAETDIFKKKK
jgi:hypothetical protein